MTDVNNEQVVAGSGVVEAVATTESVISEVAPDTGEQKQEGVPQADATAPVEKTEEQAVPYDRFKTVNDEKNDLKAQVEQLQGHLSLVGNKQIAEQPTNNTTAEQDGLTLKVMKQFGLDPEGYVSNADMAKVTDTVLKLVTEQTAQQMQQQQFIVSHPDFDKVVGHNDPETGKFIYAPPLVNVLKQSPQLRVALQNAGAGANALAYQLAVNDPAYQVQLAQSSKPASEITNEAAENAIKTAASMTSLSAAGSGGVIDKSAQILAMTDEQIKAHGEEVMRKGGVAI